MTEEGDLDKNVDPAALLLGVVALAVGTLLGGGAWTIEDSIVAIVVGVVLLAYYGRGLRDPDLSRVLAFGAVLALVGTVLLAYPVQLVATEDCKVFRPNASCTDADADEASLIALGVSTAVVGVGVRRKRQKRPARPPSPPAV